MFNSPKGKKDKAEAAWFSPRKRFSTTFSTEDRRSSFGEDPFHLRDADEDGQEVSQDILELADRAEMGFSREMTTKFTRPVVNMQRCLVMRSENKLEYRLFSNSLDFLLYARLNADKEKIEIFTFDPTEEEQQQPDTSSRSAFSLVSSSKTTAQLVRESCEHCQFSPKHAFCACSGKQQLANVRLSTKRIETATCNCLDVSIPALGNDGTPVVWCPLMGEQVPGSPTRKQVPGSPTKGREQRGEALSLITNCPSWNSEFKCLVLEFKGRTVIPSPDNFQLTLPDKPDDLVCQYGKIGDATYGLDFKQPMSIVQAFGVALSTIQLV